MDVSEEYLEMFVAGLVLDPSSNAPIVILKDTTGEICLPIWIGLAEATSIASALKKVEVSRPMTHDLLCNMVAELSGRIVKVLVTELEESTFFANIEIVVGDLIRTVDARPSDAIAIAVRVGAPIMVAEHVLEQAKVTLVPVEEGVDASEQLAGGDSEEQGANFANIEKDKWAEILAEMDPDDFKYKM